MAERNRSVDGGRDTERLMVDLEETPTDGEGRAGGRLSRDIGTRDEKKRATERPAGATRVTKADEAEGGEGSE